MAFSYNKGNTSDRDRVRLEIGDVTESTALFDNDELDDIILREGSAIKAAARACEILAVRFAREFDFTADGSGFKTSQKSEAYAKMGVRLRNRAKSDVTVPTRVDGYSDDIPSDEMVSSVQTGFEAGRWERG